MMHFCRFHTCIYKFNRHPKVGPAVIVLRRPHDSVTIETDVGDILEMVRADEKTILVLVVDGGCDYSINHPAKEVFLWLPFQTCETGRSDCHFLMPGPFLTKPN